MTRKISALVAAVACAGVCAGPAAAGTAPSKATELCGKVSASAVSSIIGYTVPAAVGETLSLKPTKKNDEIGASVFDCTFGSETSLASIKKSVSLVVDTLSRVPSAAEFKKLVEEEHTIPGSKAKIVAYPSLGSEAFLFSFSDAGITIKTLTAGSGTKLFGATVESNLSTSKLASLVKLAENL